MDHNAIFLESKIFLILIDFCILILNFHLMLCHYGLFVSARAVRDSHDSVNARYERDSSGRLLIPRSDYKNLVGWFRMAFRQKDVIITNKNKKLIVNTCMSFIKKGTLHDVCGVSWFVDSQFRHERYALSDDKLQEVVFRILIAEGIVNGVHDSTPISGMAESKTVPVTGRSRWPVIGVEGGGKRETQPVKAVDTNTEVPG